MKQLTLHLHFCAKCVFLTHGHVNCFCISLLFILSQPSFIRLFTLRYVCQKSIICIFLFFVKLKFMPSCQHRACWHKSFDMLPVFTVCVFVCSLYVVQCKLNVLVLVLLMTATEPGTKLDFTSFPMFHISFVTNREISFHQLETRGLSSNRVFQ